MSDNKRQFTDSEKLSIIQEASGSDREEVDAIAKKYGVTRDEILKWRKESKAFVAERKAETEILGYGHENEKVYLEANDAFIASRAARHSRASNGSRLPTRSGSPPRSANSSAMVASS